MAKYASVLILTESQGQRNTLSRHSDTAKAFTCLPGSGALNEYCRNGRVEIDNNPCENALRVVAMGWRNYKQGTPQ